jgi:uncharacterized protein (DUF697 family)
VGAQSSLRAALESFTDDPSLPEAIRLRLIIQLTALTCAFVAVQPLPFHHLFILSPIQLVMVIVMRRIMGRPMGHHATSELVALIVGVVGWSVVAHQVILGLYNTVIPFPGALTTIPLVYGTTFVLGYAAKAILDARRRDQLLSRAEIRAIAKELKNAHKERRDWSLRAITDEIQEWRERAELYQNYVSRETRLEHHFQELEILRSEQEEKTHHIAELEQQLASAIPEDEVDAVVEENLSLRNDLQAARELLEETRQIEALINRSREQRENVLHHRFQKCYPSLRFEAGFFRQVANLSHERVHALERQLGLLQHDPSKANFRCRISDSRAEELGFSGNGRLYVVRDGGRISIARIGDKGSQEKDVAWLRQRYSTRS